MRLTDARRAWCLRGVSPLVGEATYSIVACERATRQCGVAVQTDNLAVGASVPAAQAGVGALRLAVRDASATRPARADAARARADA